MGQPENQKVKRSICFGRVSPIFWRENPSRVYIFFAAPDGLSSVGHRRQVPVPVAHFAKPDATASGNQLGSQASGSCVKWVCLNTGNPPQKKRQKRGRFPYGFHLQQTKKGYPQKKTRPIAVASSFDHISKTIQPWWQSNEGKVSLK